MAQGVFVWLVILTFMVVTSVGISIVYLVRDSQSRKDPGGSLENRYRMLESDVINSVWQDHRRRNAEYQQKGAAQQESKSVIIVEGRAHELLPLCIENLRSQLPGWQVHIVHGKNNAEFVKELQKEHPEIQRTELAKKNFRVSEFSNLIASVYFWNNIAKTDRVLLSQIDAWICDKPRYPIETFFIYDYVGAPWRPMDPPPKLPWIVGNCGLCLCKRSAMLECVRKHPFRDFVKKNRSVAVDIYFSQNIVNVAPAVVAKAFSVENVFYPQPVGCHKPFGFAKNKKDSLKKLEPFCSGVVNLAKY